MTEIFKTYHFYFLKAKLFILETQLKKSFEFGTIWLLCVTYCIKIAFAASSILTVI